MKKRKKSFFEKITGTVKMDEFDDDLDYEDEDYSESPEPRHTPRIQEEEQIHYPNYEGNEGMVAGENHQEVGELSVDVINQPDDIIIRAIVAGVKPHDLDVQISRDMVTITGSREDSMEIEEQDYFHRELYWGSFSRNIILPEEIDVEESNAAEKHGMLELTLPKIDKNKKTKLQVKSG
jgi:HSP20 family protein